MTVPAAVAAMILLAFGVYWYVRHLGKRGMPASPNSSSPAARQPRSLAASIREAGVALRTSRSRRLQLAATLLGSITVSMLSLFLFGEVFGGDLSGLVHLIQVAPLVALLAFGWWRPGLAGALLLALGGALAAAYGIEMGGSSVSPTEQLLVAALFLMPPLLAGVLFLLAAHASRAGGPRADQPSVPGRTVQEGGQ
jgi:hypothetical protein